VGSDPRCQAAPDGLHQLALAGMPTLRLSEADRDYGICGAVPVDQALAKKLAGVVDDESDEKPR
jgi:hypothetical protein